MFSHDVIKSLIMSRVLHTVTFYLYTEYGGGGGRAVITLHMGANSYTREITGS